MLLNSNTSLYNKFMNSKQKTGQPAQPIFFLHFFALASKKWFEPQSKYPVLH